MLTAHDVSAKFIALMAGASLRVLLLTAIAGVILLLARRRSAQLEHAVWATVLISMLLLPLVSLVLPSLHLPLPASYAAFLEETAAPAQVFSSKPIVIDASRGMVADSRLLRAGYRPTAQDYLVGLYLLVAGGFIARLLIGLTLAGRLARTSSTLRNSEANLALEKTTCEQGALYPLPELLESDRISMPCVVGSERPAILLPIEWQFWDDWKLKAVLAHELTHISRGDWHWTLLAAFNKCVFWFHPLAWWLERRLATLSERASDDGSLFVLRDPKRYASVLLDVASSVPSNGLRWRGLALRAVPMASSHEVVGRIHRILDHDHPSTGVVRSRSWIAIAGCTVPLLWAVAAAQGPDVPRPTRQVAPVDNTWIAEGFKITAGEAQQFEERVARNAEDVEARSKLIYYYLYNALHEPLSKHVLWMIEHHPDSQLAVLAPTWPASTQDTAQRKQLWLQQADRHSGNPQVLGNAARFFMQMDPPAAERLLKRASEIDGTNLTWRSQLAALYARMIQADAYFRVGKDTLAHSWPEATPSYPAQVKADLDGSNDAALVGLVGANLAGMLRSSFYGRGEDESAALQARRFMAEDAEELVKRAQSLDPNNTRSEVLAILQTVRELDAQRATIHRRATSPVTVTPQPPPSSSSSRVKVGGPVQEGKLVHREPALYPPLAQQARIQGVVRFDVVIGTDGTPSNIQLRAGHPLLVPAAVEAIKKYRYQPTLLNGNPVEVETAVDVNFTM